MAKAKRNGVESGAAVEGGVARAVSDIQKLYESDPSARLLMACAVAEELGLADAHWDGRGRDNAAICSALPFWADKSMHEMLSGLSKLVESMHSFETSSGQWRRDPGGLGEGGAKALVWLCETAGIAPSEPMSAKLSALAQARADAGQPSYVEVVELFCKALVPALEKLHAAQAPSGRLEAMLASGRDRLTNEYGLSEELADELLADKPACLALMRLAYMGNEDPRALLDISRPGGSSALASIVKRMAKSPSELVAESGRDRYTGRMSAESQMHLEKSKKMIGPQLILGQDHPVSLYMKLSKNGSGYRDLFPSARLRMALFAYQAEGGLGRVARDALLRGTGTLEEGAKGKDAWAKVDRFGDLPPEDLGLPEGSARPAGSAARGESLRMALKDFREMFIWRNPSKLLGKVGNGVGAKALGLATSEADGFALRAPMALAKALDAVSRAPSERRALTASLAERFSEGFAMKPGMAPQDDLLPGYEAPESKEGGHWKAADFGSDPMGQVALAASKLHGISASTPSGLVGEAKRAFAEGQGLSGAAWKALAASEKLRGLFAKAALASSKTLAGSKAKQGIRRQAQEIMEASDASGRSAEARVEAIGAKERLGFPVGAAASLLTAAASLGMSAEEQAEMLTLCAREDAQGLRAFMSGCLPAAPKSLAAGSNSLTEAAACMPLLAEDLDAVAKLGPAMLKGLRALHARNMKRAGEAGLEQARADTARAFADVVDCSEAMPAGFWSRLDSKDPFAHAKRLHEEWVENLARSKAGADAGAGTPWISLVDKDALGRVQAKELVNARDLFEEGSAMRHCVGSYSDKCRSGASRIVSMRLDGARASTLELSPYNAKGERLDKLDFESLEQRNRVACWKAVQHRGKCNAQVTHPDLLKLASLIEERASAAFASRTAKMSEARKAEELARAGRSNLMAK